MAFMIVMFSTLAVSLVESKSILCLVSSWWTANVVLFCYVFVVLNYEWYYPVCSLQAWNTVDTMVFKTKFKNKIFDACYPFVMPIFAQGVLTQVPEEAPKEWSVNEEEIY